MIVEIVLLFIRRKDRIKADARNKGNIPVAGQERNLVRAGSFGIHLNGVHSIVFMSGNNVGIVLDLNSFHVVFVFVFKSVSYRSDSTVVSEGLHFQSQLSSLRDQARLDLIVISGTCLNESQF